MFRKILFFISIVIAAIHAGATRASIMGFGDFSNFTFNQSDGASAPTVNPVTGTVQLTNNTSFEVRSVFDNTRQNISQFTASFVFQAKGTPENASEFGASFIVQNDSVNEVAENIEGVADQFGLNSFFGSFGRSVAISLEYGSVSNNSSATALYLDAGVGGGAATTSPVNLYSGDPIDVTLTYNGSLLHENLLDTTTSASFDAFYVTNIASTLGSSTAFVGFTANTTNTSGSMDFSDLQFTNSAVPEPSSLALLGIGAGALCFISGRRKWRAFPIGHQRSRKPTRNSTL
jgi:hypothetical protein